MMSEEYDSPVSTRVEKFQDLFCDRVGNITEEGRLVLQELGEFCFANEGVPTGLDIMGVSRINGRRDVWLWVQSLVHPGGIIDYNSSALLGSK